VAKRNDLLDNLFHRPLAAVEHRTDLDRSSLDDCHFNIPSGECDADKLVMASGTHSGLIGQNVTHRWAC
jgi:hypothetical protein